MKTVPGIVVQLVHIHGPLMGTIQEFDVPEIEIGRHPSCHLSFPREVAVISRRHASIQREGNRFEIIDTSTNGTFLNGKRISRSFLKDGDVLMFTQGGPKVSFLTRLEEKKPSEPLPVSRPMVAPVPPPAAPSQETDPIVPPASVTPQHSLNQASQVQVAAVMAPLVIQYGPILQSFKELPVTLGSGPDATFKLDHPLILGCHAQIFFDRQSYWIKDLTGQRQVLVNNNPINTQSQLVPEDRLALTPQGPLFRFLAGGRLLECDDAPSDAKVNEGADTPPAGDGDVPSNPPKSIFKKLFK